MRERRLESRHAPSELALPFHHGRCQQRGIEGPLGIPELVLPQLGHLDPRERGEGPAGCDELGPRGFCIAASIESSQQPRPLREETALRPGHVPSDRIRCGPGVGKGISTRAAAEIGPTPRRPPGTVVLGIRSANGGRPRVPNRRGPGRSGALIAERYPGAQVRPRAGDRRLEACKGLLVPARARERSRQSGEVTCRGLGPALAVGVAAVDVDEQARERPDVLIVVPDHVEQRRRFPEPEELEVPRRDLPATDVRVPAQAKEHRFDGPESGVRHPVPEDATDERQQVQMARMDRRALAGEPVASHEEGPVEATTVVGHEPAGRWDVARELGEQCRLIGMVGEEELNLPKATAFPPPEADEERERPGRGREAGRLGIEAEEGSARRRLARQPGEPLPIER
jgi:hypothetical protein